jgi:hypothetical protein
VGGLSTAPILAEGDPWFTMMAANRIGELQLR